MVTQLAKSTFTEKPPSSLCRNPCTYEARNFTPVVKGLTICIDAILIAAPFGLLYLPLLHIPLQHNQFYIEKHRSVWQLLLKRLKYILFILFTRNRTQEDRVYPWLHSMFDGETLDPSQPEASLLIIFEPLPIFLPVIWPRVSQKFHIYL